MFHQLKNLFRSNNHNKLTSNPEQRKAHTKQTAERIVQEENIAKSKLPNYEGLSQYQLLKKLGEGAFSNVYKAMDKKSGQHVAIKIVRKFELNQIQKASVLKEVQIMRTLNHPSIIKMLAFIETSDYYFLVLELMNGGEIFHQIVQLTYFSEDLARHCIRQVAEGIRYLHEERGVVHRDIKPENILFESIPFMERKTSPLPTQPENEDEPKEDEGEFVYGLGGGGIGKVKIADFGLSKVVWDKHTMTPCGTVGYTAPEIVRDERYSKSVDMWALGCVLYTMLCGFPPFYDESIATLTQKVAKGQYVFLSPWWDHISVDAKHLVRHLLDVNPKKRYTIDQFLSHPWMLRQDTPMSSAPVSQIISSTTQEQKEKRIDSPDLLVPASTTTSVAAETVSMVPSSPQSIPRSSKRKDAFLSGIASMKEAFDVSYAVHRMGEERAKRKENKKLNLHEQQMRFQMLNGPSLSDSEEEDLSKDDISSDSTASSSSNDDEKHHERQIESLSKALNDTHVEDKRKSTLIRKLAGGLKADQPPTQKKRLFDSPHVVNQKPKSGFELNINNATLLGRRKNVPLVHDE
ncbi:kinase-like domain-containing protein [Gilbertella persicaria]|uniref:kinase-like domain-containing protein n=1 Tax=Gilbertella persicaria TaxID=101096 RepID=UPI00221E3F66|nr:kinase-like domain-containing protein [Gilbertella persicaria]KAI8062279.1 kinase-like domain-containing protein [Gilbertella persicaria]